MKVTKQQAPSSFQPITVNIVLETEVEYETFKEMIGYDASVPEIVYPIKTSIQYSTLRSLMGKIYRAI